MFTAQVYHQTEKQKVRFEVLQVVVMQITIVTTFGRNLLLPAAGHNSKPERQGTDTDMVGMELGTANKQMGVMALWP